MQNRAARIITGKSYEIRTSELLKELNWQTLEERRESGRFTFMFNVKNQEAPENMANLFRFSNNEKYDLRNNGIIIFNWINLRLISSKKVLATQGQNAGIICQMRLRQKK